MKAVRITKQGGPEVLQLEQVDKPIPKANEALVKLTVAGINFVDTYQRSGLYKVELPAILGTDAAGIIESLGDNVDPALGLKKGNRVTFVSRGTYAEYISVSADKLIVIPEGISDEVATAAMVQGMTAHYLLHSSYAVKKGDFILVHAAAGGTGQFLIQIGLLLGAQVIGTVSTPEKVEVVKNLGVQHVINYKEQDIEKEVLKITKGNGVQAVYDGVGKTTYEASFKSVATRGTVILFGNASGPIPPVDLLQLPRSIYIQRPTLAYFTLTREELLWRANDVFKWIKEGKLKVSIHKEFPLADAAKAHIEIQSGASVGKFLLRINQAL